MTGEWLILLLSAADWSGVEALRTGIDCPSQPALLAHYRGQDAAYAAFSCGPLLRSVAMLRFDDTRWLRIEFSNSPRGAAAPAARASGLFERRWNTAGDTLVLSASFTGSGDPPAIEPFIDPDLAGLRAGDRIVLFHTATRTARSTLSIDITGDGPYRFLIGGLGSGTWEIWRAGWLEDHQAGVDAGAGALVFSGRGGGYFFRRLGR